MALRILLLCCFLLTIVQIICVQEIKALDITLGFIQEPKNVIAEKNQPFILNCSVSSRIAYGPVNITWRHQGIEINETRRRVLNNGSLYFQRIIHQKKTGESDGGLYQCIASNKVGSLVSHNASLTIANVSRKFVENPLSQTVEDGDVVRFACQIKAVPLPVYTWQKNQQDLPQDARWNATNNSGVLLINGVKKSDAGKYRCYISSYNIQRYSQEALLEVNSGSNKYRYPNILTPLYNPTVKQGDEVLIECAASGFPKPVITWQKDDKDEFDRKRTQFIGQGNLKITNVQANDSGAYTCTATNENPETKESHSVTQVIILKVLVPPTILKKPQSLLVLTVKTARLECEVSGDPPPRVFWLKNSRSIPINGRIKSKINNNNYSLVILQPVTNDSGIYQCVAQNLAGVAIATARLQINSSKDQPYPPTGLRAETLSSTSIKLFWNASTPQNGLPINAYTVHYAPVQGGDELQKVSVASSQVVDQLKPFTNYSFYVRSYNARSGSDESETIVWSTGEEIPLAVPSITLNSLSSTTLQVSWDDLPSDVARGIIIKYKIFWRLRGNLSYLSQEIPGDVREYTITDLKPNTEYEVSITGATQKGYPSLGDSVWPWVRHKMPSLNKLKEFSNNMTIVEPPSYLEASPKSSTSISVSWKEPLSSKNISYFTVRYNPVPNTHAINASSVYYLRSTGKVVVINDLIPYTLYEISVSSHDQNNHQGPYSQKVSCKTGEDVPTAPTELHWKPVDYHSVLIMWQPPEFPNGLIVNYYVLYNTEKSLHCNTENWITKEEKGTVLSTQINGLASNTFYYFCLRAKTKIGTGPPTDVIALNLRSPYTNMSSTHPVFDEEFQDPRLGIIVGISIGIGCMIICAVVVMIRNRFFPPSPESDESYIHQYHLNGNGHLLHARCNGHSNGEHRFSRADSHELEIFVPMLSSMNENVSSHLDTKGGYPLPYYQGEKNGSALHPIFHESCMLNGHAMRDKQTINITVNPQHKSWDAKNGYHYTSAEDDDNLPLPPSILLSDVEIDDTIISMSEQSQNGDSGVQLALSQEAESYNQDCCSLQGSECEQSSDAVTAASGNVLPQNEDSPHSHLWNASSKHTLQAHHHLEPYK